MLLLLTDSNLKLKLEKIHGALIILFYVSPSSPPLQSRFKETAKIFSKNSTTQENITISRQNLLFLLETRKNKQPLFSKSAFVRKVLSNLYFFHQMIALQKL